MPITIDLTGHKYGSLSVVSFAGYLKTKRMWNVKCDCGTEYQVRGEGLRSGNTTSCGCKRAESLAKRNVETAKRDGKTQTRTGKCWQAMIRRCYCEKDSCYHIYGARGINVCEFLRVSPTNLMSIIGERPLGRMSIDRIENNDGYHCGKCAECFRNNWVLNIRWATDKQQARNNRKNRILTINGLSLCVAEWAERMGLSPSVLHDRLKRGKSGADVIAPKYSPNQK